MDDVYQDERILLNRVSQGDRAAFNRLYVVHIENVYNYIYLFTHSKEETEELVQEIFVHLWEHRKKLAAVTSFKHYVFRSAKNKLINHIRHNRIKARVLSEIRERGGASPVTPDHAITYKEHYRLILEAIEKLPPKRKNIFKMHTEEGISYAAIAEELNISISVVKKQYYKARQFVCRYLHINGEILLILLFLPLRFVTDCPVF